MSNDREEGKPVNWLLAQRVLHRNRPSQARFGCHGETLEDSGLDRWGHFVAEIEAQGDKDRIREGSPWHVSKNAIILAEFKDCMRPDEVFERFNLWDRVPNLPYNLRDDAWVKLITQQIDKEATSVQFDHVGGYLIACNLRW